MLTWSVGEPSDAATRTGSVNATVNASSPPASSASMSAVSSHSPTTRGASSRIRASVEGTDALGEAPPSPAVTARTWARSSNESASTLQPSAWASKVQARALAPPGPLSGIRRQPSVSNGRLAAHWNGTP